MYIYIYISIWHEFRSSSNIATENSWILWYLFRSKFYKVCFHPTRAHYDISLTWILLGCWKISTKKLLPLGGFRSCNLPVLHPERRILDSRLLQQWKNPRLLAGFWRDLEILAGKTWLKEGRWVISSDNTLFALPKYEIIFLLFVGTSSSTSSKRNIFYTSLHEYRLFLRVSFTSIFLPRLTVRSIEGLQEAFATGHNTCICRCSEVACNEFIDWVSSRKRDGLLCYEKGKKSPDQISTNPSAFNQRIFPNESMICGQKTPRVSQSIKKPRHRSHWKNTWGIWPIQKGSQKEDNVTLIQWIFHVPAKGGR